MSTNSRTAPGGIEIISCRLSSVTRRSGLSPSGSSRASWRPASLAWALSSSEGICGGRRFVADMMALLATETVYAFRKNETNEINETRQPYAVAAFGGQLWGQGSVLQNTNYLVNQGLETKKKIRPLTTIRMPVHRGFTISPIFGRVVRGWRSIERR